MRKLSAGWIVLIVIVAVIAVLGASVAGKYNTLVAASENIDGRWSEVENVLQYRADLIPNMVETVKGYAAHEQEIFTAIAEARSKLIGANGVEETAEAANALNSALGRLLMITENYPDLKANQNFIALQDTLAGTENRLKVARKDYNDAVQAYNVMVKRFPTNISASIFGYGARDYFEIDESARAVPKVAF